MRKRLAVLALAIGIGGIANAGNIVTTSSVFNGVMAPSRNVDYDIGSADNISVQVVYSSAIPAAVTFKDGTVSTGNITVASLTGLTTAYATEKITVSSDTAIGRAVLYFNLNPIVEGKNWNYDVKYASNSAIALCNFLNASYSTLFLSTVTLGDTVIYSTAATYGSAANAYTLTSSTQAALVVNSATFTGGQDAAILTIGNYPLVANKDFFPVTSAAVAATNIAAAINAIPVNAIIKAQAIGSVVYATSTVTGYHTNYAMTTSTLALTLSGALMTGGTKSDITPNFTRGLTDPNYYLIRPSAPDLLSTVYKAPTKLGVAHPLLYTTSAGTAPGGLVAGTTYFASNLTASTFQISDTSTGAVAGTFIAITTVTQAGGGTFVLTPIALTGTPTFKLQASNDATNFQDVYISTSPILAPAQASVSFASPYSSSNVLWQLGNATYRYLRFAFTGGTFGGVNVNEIINVKGKN